MEFHISCHHTPNNCGVHRREPGSSNTVPNWSEHCKKVGITYIKGGVNPPQHDHFLFVETDDMSKLRDLMQPYQGYWDVTITPVMNLA
jgi:hypothetical protein|tara:strand:- start:413 stop:676 length:264 start_codon:yes stop_codon:yes gene_type:complete